jgi:hypothetical protein
MGATRELILAANKKPYASVSPFKRKDAKQALTLLKLQKMVNKNLASSSFFSSTRLFVARTSMASL